MKIKYAIISLLGFLVFANPIFASDVVRITTGEWPPYMSQELKNFGLVNHIVAQSFALEGVKVEWAWLPWKRAMKDAKTGKAVATSFWFKTEERKKDFYFSEPLVSSEYVFFHLKGYAFDWKTMDDLKGKTIVAEIAADQGKDFMDAEKTGKINVIRTKKDYLGIHMLLKKRANLFVGNIENTFFLMRKNFTPEQGRLITFHPAPVRSEPGYLLFSKKASNGQSMLKLFNRGLKKLKDSKKYDEFVDASRRGDYTIKK